MSHETRNSIFSVFSRLGKFGERVLWKEFRSLPKTALLAKLDIAKFLPGSRASSAEIDKILASARKYVLPCRLGARKFEAVLSSFEDEHGEKCTVLSLKEGDRWIVERARHCLITGPFESKSRDSLCGERIFAREVSSQKVAFITYVDNMPSPEAARVSFFDFQARSFLSYIDVPISAPSSMRIKKNRLFILEEYQPTDSTACGDCVSIGGIKSTRVDDSALSVWRTPVLKGSTIELVADPIETWKNSPIGSYFPSQESFEKALGFDSAQGRFARGWYRYAVFPDGRTCVYPTKTDPFLLTFNSGAARMACRDSIRSNANWTA